jgi:hypothetical protein
MERKHVYRNSDGVRRTLHWRDDDPDSFAINTEVDVSQLVKHNAEIEALLPQRATNKLVARVPLTIYEQSIREDWDEDQWKHWLNDSDNAMFRIWKGKV